MFTVAVGRSACCCPVTPFCGCQGRPRQAVRSPLGLHLVNIKAVRPLKVFLPRLKRRQAGGGRRFVLSLSSC
jgi:hypothetical protein